MTVSALRQSRERQYRLAIDQLRLLRECGDENTSAEDLVAALKAAQDAAAGQKNFAGKN